MEACSIESVRAWNNADRKANTLFHVLVRGTYVWQKSVSKKESLYKKEESLSYFVMTHFYLLDHDRVLTLF